MTPDASVVLVSFNTRDLTRECLNSLYESSTGVEIEVLVVDNASRDASAEMIEREFPQVRLFRTDVNLGFGGGNNLAFPHARGRYVVLLNTDAFLKGDALQRSIAYMDADSRIGVGGGKLVGRDGSWQPSGHQFPSPLNDLLRISGVATKFAESRFFGREQFTWSGPDRQVDVDWVTGAYAVIPRAALEKIGYFDERFFLYYEEVDLCRRFKQAGYLVRYWPDVEVIHLGGESSKTVTDLRMSKSGAQLELWRMRSELLYYRKHHGGTAWVAKEVERQWHQARLWKNSLGLAAQDRDKAEESRMVARLLQQAWKETAGGAVSPSRPW
jgi:GT2 family glycosyltransferase